MHEPLILSGIAGPPRATAEFLARFLPLLDERRWAQQHAHSPSRELELLAAIRSPKDL
jgi:hypothetical protein